MNEISGVFDEIDDMLGNSNRNTQPQYGWDPLATDPPREPRKKPSMKYKQGQGGYNNTGNANTSRNAYNAGTAAGNSGGAKAKKQPMSSEGVTTLEKAMDLLLDHCSTVPAYRDELNSLMVTTDFYDSGNKLAKEHIAKKFPPPQITYSKYMGELKESEEVFVKIICKSADLMSVSASYSTKSPETDEMLMKLKQQTQALTNKIEALITALIKNKESQKDDTNDKFEEQASDMDELIDAIKDYD
jgi:hypothetical protein